MAERKSMGEDEIKALVAREIALADTDGKELSKRQTKALQYFQGQVPDYPPEAGRSKVVSHDLADVMGWMHPSLMRVFCASDRFGECEPVGDDDEAWAKQATEGVNYVFWKENDGYRVLYDSTWDAMLGADGIIKVWWDDTPKESIAYFTGLTDDALADLEDDESVEILAQSDYAVEIEDPESGGKMSLPVHDVKIRRQDDGGKVCVEAIPPEDYGIDGAARTCREARFQYHRVDKTRSDLIEMGFDKAVVHRLGRAAENDSAESQARLDYDPTDDGDFSMEVVDYYECFIKADVDGDGIAEMLRVQYAGTSGGGELLDWEVWEDDAPFYSIPYKPMPHRFVSRSVFDETEDIQQIKTALQRQALDNIYAANNPQRFVKGKITNPEELFSPSFGGAIFGGSDAEIMPLAVPFVANHAFDALNYEDQVTQRRTGVSRQTMALDPEALTNQSATANQNEKDASYSQIELVARNMAEFGFVHVFKAILKLLIKHQDTPKTIRLSSKAVKIDPRWWNADMDVTINVGLGTGSRDRDMLMLQQVLMNQQTLAASFLSQGATAQAIDMLPKIITTMVKIAESAGLRNPSSFYPDGVEELVADLKQLAEAAAGQPDPQVQLEQAKLQIHVESERAKAEAAAVKERAQMEADLVTKAADRDAQLLADQQKQDFEREKLQAEYQFKMVQLAQERELALLQMGMQERDSGETDDGGNAVKKPVDATAAMLMDGLSRLGSMIEGLGASLSAPTEIVRGPDGRAVGTRKVVN